MAPELSPDEHKKYDYETLVLRKGVYSTVTILNWLSKTDSIKDVFHELMKDSSPDKQNPCVEWYKSDDEMMCMVRDVNQS